jgi:hypothetical protein
MMTTPSNEDSDAAWVAVFLSEAVMQMAEGEGRAITVDIVASEARTDSASFMLRFAAGPEFLVTVARNE